MSTNAVPSTTQSVFSSVVNVIETPFIAVKNFVARPVQFIAQRIQDLWRILQPYVVATASFLTSRVGISLGLLSLSIIPFQLFRTADNKALSIALLAGGILMAGAGGFLLCSSGILPAFLPKVTPIVRA
jgi:hypothetical protein